MLTFKPAEIASFSLPGIYEIYCFSTGKSYFGETHSLLERFCRHYRALENQEKNYDDAPMLHHDWMLYGSQAFEFCIVHSGEEWKSKKRRRAKELELLLRHQTRVYNKFPQTSSKYHIRCLIDEKEYSSVAQAAKALNLSPSEVRRRLNSDKYPRYFFLEKVPNAQPITFNGKTYSSIQEAAKSLGITRSSFYRQRKKLGKDERSVSNDYPEGE
jgi:DNA-binding NtrC family response regulator